MHKVYLSKQKYWEISQYLEKIANVKHVAQISLYQQMLHVFHHKVYECFFLDNACSNNYQEIFKIRYYLFSEEETSTASSYITPGDSSAGMTYNKR